MSGRGGFRGSNWCPEYDAKLIASITDGDSYREAAGKINTQFGTSFSRNAAIGRGKRLGLCTGEAKRLEKLRACMGKARSAPRKPVERKVKIMPRSPIFVCDAATGRREAAVEPLHITLLDLAPSQCRWPYGDHAFTFCGHPMFCSGPYCEPHSALALGERRQVAA